MTGSDCWMGMDVTLPSGEAAVVKRHRGDHVTVRTADGDELVVSAGMLGIDYHPDAALDSPYRLPVN